MYTLIQTGHTLTYLYTVAICYLSKAFINVDLVLWHPILYNKELEEQPGLYICDLLGGKKQK